MEGREGVEDVEFGEVKSSAGLAEIGNMARDNARGVVVDGGGIFDDDQVKPAAAPPSASCDAILVADLLHFRAGFLNLGQMMGRRP